MSRLAAGVSGRPIIVGRRSAVEVVVESSTRDEDPDEDKELGVGVEEEEVLLIWRTSTGQDVASGLAALRDEDSAAASSRV